MDFFDYSKHSQFYSKIEIEGTYYLAFRDIETMAMNLTQGTLAMDYGCGTGRSTRFLQELGYKTFGVDISEKMVELARKNDSSGEYTCINSGELPFVGDESLDLILCGFVLDSVSSKKAMVKIFVELTKKMKKSGVIVNITSTPELYSHDWASFQCNFPENKNSKSGDKVKCVIRGDEEIDVTDFYWTREDYEQVFAQSGLKVVEAVKPLATGEEPFDWINETKIAPWFVDALTISD